MSDQPCAFCAIARGESPAHEVWRDEQVVAFLDRRPLFPGHVLVCPVAHRATMADLAAAEVGPLFERARTIATAVEAAMGASGTFVAVNQKVSQSVPHLHVHVVPRTKGDGLRGFFWPRTRYDDDAQMADVADRIARALT